MRLSSHRCEHPACLQRFAGLPQTEDFPDISVRWRRAHSFGLFCLELVMLGTVHVTRLDPYYPQMLVNP